MTRKKFDWVDPTSKKAKKYRDICTTPQFLHLLENVIESPEQAESFMAAYSQACDNAVYNIGYFARFINDKELRDDVLDLFGVEIQHQPKQVLNKEYQFHARRSGG